jgi:hypothetical protein
MPLVHWALLADIIRREHLYRHHMRHEGECMRCAEKFGTANELEYHQRRSEVCQKRRLSHKMSTTQSLQIDEVTKSGTAIDQWIAINQILVPLGHDIPSPYSQNEELGGAKGKGKGLKSLQQGDHAHHGTGCHGVREASEDPLQLLRDATCEKVMSQVLEDQRVTVISVMTVVDACLSTWPQAHHQSGFEAACDAEGSQRADNEASGSNNAGESSGSSQGDQPGNDRKRKRGGKVTSNDDPGDDGDPPDDPPGSSKRPKGKDMKLACPFLKMFPWIYRHHKHCLGTWPNTSRLKEHLYRQHLQKETCNRCCKAFDSLELLIEHQRSDIPCQKRPKRPSEGIDETQLRLLKCKKNLGSTEEAKCQRIYAILWPSIEAKDLPTFHWESSGTSTSNEPSSSEIVRFIKSRLSPLIQSTLEEEFPLGEFIPKSRVVEIVSNSFQTLCEEFLSSPGRISPPVVSAEQGQGEPLGEVQSVEDANDVPQSANFGYQGQLFDPFFEQWMNMPDVDGRPFWNGFLENEIVG